MFDAHWLNEFPLWVIFLITLLTVVLSIKVGIPLCRARSKSNTAEEDSAVNTAVTSSLALLAFILAFTFQMTGSRLDGRKQALIDAVNAIETTYLRADLIPEPHRSEVRELLKEYVDARIDMMNTPDKLEERLRDSEAIQKKLWSQVAALAEADLKNPAVASKFIDSLNEMIDMQTTRVVLALIQRIPITMWVLLGTMTILAMISVGYLFGKSEKTNWVMVGVLALAFTCVLSLIIALDRSGSNPNALIKVNQKPMIDLHERLNAPP